MSHTPLPNTAVAADPRFTLKPSDLVAAIVAAILYTSGAQIANVFSNVAAALGSPSP